MDPVLDRLVVERDQLVEVVGEIAPGRGRKPEIPAETIEALTDRAQHAAHDARGRLERLVDTYAGRVGVLFWI